jgi:glucose-1-phosphate cytidylyltransferase
MKVVLFCGGLGTRLGEYSATIPKPLVPIGYRPIIWTLMKYYAHFGHEAFILCLGYRGDLIKEFFLNFNECMSNDFTLSQGGAKIDLDGRDIENWMIRFVDTGLKSNIGQRLMAVRKYLENDSVFLANYTDGLVDLKLNEYVDWFLGTDAVAAFVSVRPAHSLSGVEIAESSVVTSIEYLSDTIWINGGYFIFRPEIFDYIRDGEEIVEEPFHRLIGERRLLTFKHPGFFAALDTLKDKKLIDDLYESGNPPWEVWNRASAD